MDMRFALALLASGSLLMSCSNASPGAPSSPGELAASSLPRHQSPDTTDAELSELTAANASFAWRLYHETANDGQNLFLSPYSVSIALAMTWAGARGDTENEMARALDFTLAQARLHPGFNALDLELASRGEDAGSGGALPFRLNVTNTLFGQRDFAFLDTFLDTLALNYGAGLQLMDFASQPEASRIVINDWVSDETEARIDELLPPGTITRATRLLLVNAIYFTASWADPFDEADTTERAFTLGDGTDAIVPMMHGSVRTFYTEGPNYEAALLGYDGGKLAMLLIVPDAGAFDSVEETMSASTVSAIRNDLSVHQVELALPRFSFRSKVPARPPLEALGMVDAFTDAADFSGMTGDRSLRIDDVVHEAFIAVDERGTEAAAATAVIAVPVSAPPPAELTVDRPFLFAILDLPTGATLFVGRVVDPSQP